jgi:hypothetical protein
VNGFSININATKSVSSFSPKGFIIIKLFTDICTNFLAIISIRKRKYMKITVEENDNLRRIMK